MDRIDEEEEDMAGPSSTASSTDESTIGADLLLKVMRDRHIVLLDDDVEELMENIAHSGKGFSGNQALIEVLLKHNFCRYLQSYFYK